MGKARSDGTGPPLDHSPRKAHRSASQIDNLPSSVIKLLGQGTTQEKIDMNTSTSEMKASWIQRGIRPAMVDSRPGSTLDIQGETRDTPAEQLQQHE